MPKVSVILPFHNPGKYFPAAVESILAQTFRDFEVLLLDDASDDGSSETAHEITNRDPRVKIIRSETNLSLSPQLNRGIEAADGELVARMDADDISSPTRFEKQVSVFKNFPRVGICGSIVVEILASGELSGYQWELPSDHDDIVSLQFLRCGFSHPSVMMRKSVLVDHSLRYREDYQVAQDYELWFRILQVTEGFNIQEPLLKYRRFPDQLSQASSPRKLHEVGEIRNRILEFVGLDSDENNQIMHRRFCEDNWPRDLNWFREMIGWLNIVYNTNRDSGAIPNAAFGRLLAERLCMQCYMATGRAFNAHKLFRFAEFKQHARVGVVDSLKTLVKSIVRS